MIERSTSNWSRTLTLNKGTSLGVEKGDCVVDQYGYLVGVITDAGGAEALKPLSSLNLSNTYICSLRSVTYC